MRRMDLALRILTAVLSTVCGQSAVLAVIPGPAAIPGYGTFLATLATLIPRRYVATKP